MIGLLAGGAVLAGITAAAPADWKNFPEYPEWMQRGSVRVMFPVWLPDENYAMAGCNFFRGSPYDGYAERKVFCMGYVSPTDFFWHDRLLKVYGISSIEKGGG